jgi:hypothetical protein
MAGDMESLLLKGDDSSSGESDSEQHQISAPMIANVNRAAVASGPTTLAGVPTGSMSQSEMAQRLKSMYSPASKSSGGSSQSVVPLPTNVPPQPSLTTPVSAQQALQHQSQQHAPQQQNASAAVATYRPSSTNELAPQQQQQQRSVLHQQPQRGEIHVRQQQQQLKQRPVVGIPPQAQSAPVGSSSSLPPEQQHSRSVMHQMQAPTIPHRPVNRIPHQQQNARHIPHAQTQAVNAQSIRTQTSVAPSQSVQQNVAPRSGGYSAIPQQQQQVPQVNTLDRAVMEKKQKERFLVFTRVLMVCI